MFVLALLQKCYYNYATKCKPTPLHFMTFTKQNRQISIKTFLEPLWSPLCTLVSSISYLEGLYCVCFGPRCTSWCSSPWQTSWLLWCFCTATPSTKSAPTSVFSSVSTAFHCHWWDCPLTHTFSYERWLGTFIFKGSLKHVSLQTCSFYICMQYLKYNHCIFNIWLQTWKQERS